MAQISKSVIFAATTPLSFITLPTKMKSALILVTSIASMAAASPMPADLETHVMECGWKPCPRPYTCCEGCSPDAAFFCHLGNLCPKCRPLPTDRKEK